MSLFVQKNLIRWILQPLADFSGRIPEKVKDVLFVLCGCGIFSLNVLNNTAACSLRYLYVCAFCCVMMGIMLLCTLPGKLSPVKLDWKLFLPWLGFTAFILIAGLTKSIEYLADTMLYLVMFPVIFLVWNNTDFSRVVRLLVGVARVTAIGFFAISAICFPITGAGYASCFTNENEFAFFLTTIFVLLLFGFLNGKKTSVLRWLDLLLLGVSWAMIFYSNSRTGQLACIIAGGSTLLLMLILERKWIRNILWDILPVALAMVLCIQVVIPAFMAIHRVADKCQNAIVTLFEEKDPLPSGNPTTPGSDPTAPTTEPTQPGTEPTNSASADEVIQSILEKQEEKLDTDRTLTRISSGRLDIWKNWLAHVTFWGHSLEETFVYSLEGEETESTTAHMTQLQMAYQYGALAGILYLLYNLIAGVKSLAYAIKNPQNRWAYVPLCISLAFGCICVLASVDSPFGYMISLCYYLMQTPLMVGKTKE